MRIKINKEVCRVNEWRKTKHSLPTITLEDGREYIVCTYDEATTHVRDRWLDMARNDPEEFAGLIGGERLTKWALGHSDEYGISSLQEFVEVASSHPEEELASYDGEYCSVKRVGKLLEKLDLLDTKDDLVAFRTN